MSRTVAEKMGVKAGARAYFRGADDVALAAMALPALDRRERLAGEFDYLHLFAIARAGLERDFPALAKHLAPGGSFWVSWPKGRGMGSDLTLPLVIEIGYDHGLVESKALAIDQRWSALKFTHLIPGKIYRNSFGKLPGQPA